MMHPFCQALMYHQDHRPSWNTDPTKLHISPHVKWWGILVCSSRTIRTGQWGRMGSRWRSALW